MPEPLPVDDPALLAAILADPADDTVRLVYADWLEENGQTARAEFVRVQIALTRTPAVVPVECAMSERAYRAMRWPRGHWALTDPAARRGVLVVPAANAAHDALVARETKLWGDPTWRPPPPPFNVGWADDGTTRERREAWSTYSDDSGTRRAALTVGWRVAVRWRRGFPYYLHADPTTFRVFARDLFRRLPITQATATGTPWRHHVWFSHLYPMNALPYRADAAVLPDELFRLLPGVRRATQYEIDCPNPAAALAEACLAFGRSPDPAPKPKRRRRT